MYGIPSAYLLKNLVVTAYKHLLHFISIIVNNRNIMARTHQMPSLGKRKEDTFLFPST